MADQKPAATKMVPGIKVIARADSFRRAGRVFTVEPTLIALDSLKKEQIEQLRREPLLVVVDTEVPAPEAPAAEASTKK